MFMTKTSAPLVSVIIPIYNIENYLSACLDSIINQSYQNLEILAVDDGSSDDSYKIASVYAAKDKRIKVLQKPNGGLSDARNYGYDHCHGEYVAFIDGDDYISKYYIETLIHAIIANNSDISTCKYKLAYTTNDKSLENKPTEESKTLSAEEALRSLFYQKDVTTSAWGKLYKKELFADIKYPKGKKYEDLATTYKVFAKANKVTICNAKLLYYMQRESSIMGQAFKPERLDGLRFAEEAVDFTKKYYPNLEKAASNRVFMEAVHIFEEINPRTNKDARDQVWQVIKQYRSIVKSDKQSKKNMRAYARVSYLGKQALRTALDAKERYGELSARRLQK